MLKRFAKGLGKFLLKAVAVLVLLACLASAWGGIVSLQVKRPALRGELVDIGGRRLRIVCEGPRSSRPLVVLESGIYGFASDWGEVQKGLAANGWRSCAYDRAGLAFSDPGPAPRDSDAIARDLDALLKAHGEAGPIILVGHSMAGLHTRLFAYRHPGVVRGLVLVDAVSPDSVKSPYGRRMLAFFRQLARGGGVFTTLGLAKPFTALADAIGLRGPAHEEKVFFFGRVGHNRWAAAEAKVALPSALQVLKAGSLDPNLPVGVVTEGPEALLRTDWGRERIAPAKAARQGFFENIPTATHASMLGKDHAAVIVRMIERVAIAAGYR